MSHKFWFKPKTYGYRATPTTWEEWAAVAVYVLVLVGCIMAMTARRESPAIDAASIATMIVATVVLIAVSVQITDGALGWNAGAKQLSGKNQ
jgi:glycerol uptake facilitator-like aquaporin